jgi:hypothetical protein
MSATANLGMHAILDGVFNHKRQHLSQQV